VFGGEFIVESIQAEMSAMGIDPMRPPSVEASRTEVLQELWTAAGLEAVETQEITVNRTFSDFEDLWTISMLSPVLRPLVATMPSGDVDTVRQRVRARLPADVAGRIAYSARANAIKGRVPE